MSSSNIGTAAEVSVQPATDARLSPGIITSGFDSLTAVMRAIVRQDMRSPLQQEELGRDPLTAENS